MTDQAKIDAANSFFARKPLNKGIDLEAIKHIEVALKDMAERAFTAMIIAGKQGIQQAAGDDAAVDLYTKAKNVVLTTMQAQVFSSLVFAALTTKKVSTQSDFEFLLCKLMLKALNQHEELLKLGSSVTHLARKG